MDIGSIKGHTHEYGAPPGMEDIVHPLRVRLMQEGPLFFLVSEWVPTAEERARIAAGENIFLAVMGTGMPPVMLTVGPEPEVAHERGDKPGLVVVQGGKRAEVDGGGRGSAIPDCNCSGRGLADITKHAANCPLRFGGIEA